MGGPIVPLAPSFQQIFLLAMNNVLCLNKVSLSYLEDEKNNNKFSQFYMFQNCCLVAGCKIDFILANVLQLIEFFAQGAGASSPV